MLDFEQKYGISHPPFYQGGYSQALEYSKKELKYLLVLLNSEGHDDSDAFCSFLTTDAIVSFLSSGNFVIWAGSVGESEGLQVSSVLNAYGYPFVALIAMEGTQMVTIDRFEGLIEIIPMKGYLERHVIRLDAQYAVLRADMNERKHARSIREQQDFAYQSSLKADEFKQRKAKELEMAVKKEKIEHAKALETEKARVAGKGERRKYLLNNQPIEPSDETENISKISVRLPSGARVVRKFYNDDTVQVHLYKRQGFYSIDSIGFRGNSGPESIQFDG